MTVARLLILIASTRPERVGLPVAEWFIPIAHDHGGFEVEVADLAEPAPSLPLLDEPNHPRLRRYTRPHTIEWSERVDASDAFVFVMPEYNHGYSGALKNAIDYLMAEWAYKPVGFVSYGGVSGGLRAVQQLKPVLTCLKMTPLTEAVTIPWVGRRLDEDRRFVPEDIMAESAVAMLDELSRMESALRELREAARA